jgi:hypothetical protein
MSLAIATPAPVAGLAPLVADLFLVRLLPAMKRTPSAKTLEKDLAKFFRHAPSAEQWRELADSLRAEGFLEAKSLRLTEAGRARALRFLGAKELPHRANWKTLKARHLVPKALGLAPSTAETDKRVRREDGLAALLLRRRFRLPVSAGSNLTQVFEALACRQLGFPDVISLKDLKDLALSQLLGESEALDSKQLAKQLPRILLGASRGGLDALRETVLCGWADSSRETAPEAPVPAPAEFDIQTFAASVKAAARDCPAGWFGDNKVFISHVWRRLGDEPGFPRLDLPEFKDKLVEANANSMLRLSRADLVQIMDPTDVAESETHYRNAVFHFILVDKDQP